MIPPLTVIPEVVTVFVPETSTVRSAKVRPPPIFWAPVPLKAIFPLLGTSVSAELSGKFPVSARVPLVVNVTRPCAFDEVMSPVIFTVPEPMLRFAILVEVPPVNVRPLPIVSVPLPTSIEFVMLLPEVGASTATAPVVVSVRSELLRVSVVFPPVPPLIVIVLTLASTSIVHATPFAISTAAPPGTGPVGDHFASSLQLPVVLNEYTTTAALEPKRADCAKDAWLRNPIERTAKKPNKL